MGTLEVQQQEAFPQACIAVGAIPSPNRNRHNQSRRKMLKIRDDLAIGGPDPFHS